MQFAKLYTIRNNQGKKTQILYQRLKHRVKAQDTGEEKVLYLLISTVECGDDTSVSTLQMESEAHMNKAFELITQQRAEALLLSMDNANTTSKPTTVH